MPVYNGEKYLRNALDSLLSQTFVDFELIISDNASTDSTEAICREYAVRDQRISYVRQPTNIGAASNFKFVLDEARGEYFMWAACDDTRSPDFVERNYKFLSENPEYVASTSPNGFEGRSLDKQYLVDFALDGEIFERFIRFFDYCWVSHGIFYSLVRTNVLQGCEYIGKSFTAADWAIILYLAKQGRLNRSKEGWTIFGTKGISSGPNALNAFRNIPIERVLPLFRITKITLDLIKHFPARHRGSIIFALGKVNCRAARIQLTLVLRKCFGLVMPG
jgi:glycosyltransferase involved in cell wall biosynthesis